jgi:hypothetical protein
MLRKTVILLLGLALGLSASSGFGQDWARKMFKDFEYDFGTVAKDAKTEHVFTFENLYMEDIHIASATQSCHCTSVRIENPLVKTYEKGSIVAHFNTDTFQGPHSATISVVIDKPYYAEVQLHVKGVIRTDTVVEPGSVQFPSIDQGVAYDQKVTVSHTGQSNWQISEVKSSNPHITAKAVETGRNYGQVSYELRVRIDADAPSGYLGDHLTLVTNNPQMPQVPVLVEGRVVPTITVSPTSLVMGTVQPGQQVTKKLVIKGKKPFHVLSISCGDESFKFEAPADADAKELHVIPVTFTAGADLGKITKSIKIETDAGQSVPELSVYAVVAAAK